MAAAAPGPYSAAAEQGAGKSLAAIKGRVCIDTTMGFTPLEGLVMATRSGFVDPGLLLELMREGYDAKAMAGILQKESGLSGDIRELRNAASNGHNGAIRALNAFRHRLIQLLGAIATSLSGVDVLSVAGAIGEHGRQLQGELKQALSWWGDIDLIVTPAEMEGMIARLCRRHSTIDPTSDCSAGSAAIG